MWLFRKGWAWLLGQRPIDLGYMPLDNPHIRMVMYLGELRTKADMWSMVVSGPIKVGDRVVEERERRVAAMNARATLRMYRGGRG